MVKKIVDLFIPKDGTKERRKLRNLIKDSASKDKIEWDAVETIPILLYTDNFTLLSVYKRGIKPNALYLRK